MTWYVIAHDPKHPEDTSIVTIDEGIGSVEMAAMFPDEEQALDYIDDAREECPIYEYSTIKL